MNNGDKPAYPVECQFNDDGTMTGLRTGEYAGLAPGLTKREMFAMNAMQGLLANAQFIEAMGHYKMDHKNVVAVAIGVADELLKQLDNDKAN